MNGRKQEEEEESKGQEKGEERKQGMRIVKNIKR